MSRLNRKSRANTISSRAFLVLLGIMIVATGASCAKSRQPWIENGDRLGTIQRVKDGAGQFYDYRDSRGQLIRRERHLRNRDLDPSFAIEHYRYDDAGYETNLSFTNARGEASLGPPGFAMRRTERRPAQGGWLIDHRHYDSNDSPMSVPAGYHREEVQVDARNGLKRRRFYDDRDRPVGVALEHASNIIEVQYKTLMGTTPILYETFIGIDGKPVLKRQLSGSTSSVRFTRIDYRPRGYDH